MEFLGTIDESHRLIYPPVIAGLRDSFLKSCKPGTVVKEKLTRQYPKKSQQQIKTIWGLVIEMVKREFDDRGWDLNILLPTANIPSGIPVPRDVFKTVFYAACSNVGDQGERRTMSEMNILEMSRFFENCRDHAARTWGIVVPDPDPAWRDKLAVETVKDGLNA